MNKLNTLKIMLNLVNTVQLLSIPLGIVSFRIQVIQ